MSFRDSLRVVCVRAAKHRPAIKSHVRPALSQETAFALHKGAIQASDPMIAVPTTMTSKSLVSHFGIRVNCWVMCSTSRVSGVQQPSIVTDRQRSALAQAGLLFHRKGTAYEHEIVVDRAAIVAADKLAMEPIEVATNPTIAIWLEHMTDPDPSNDGSAGGLQSALAYGIRLVEIHDIR